MKLSAYPNRVFLAVLLLTVCAGYAAIEITAGPYLQNPTETAMTVMWTTSVKSTAAVEYGSGDALDQKAVSITDGQIDANTTIHRVRITGLEAGREYRYRVASTEITDYQPYKVVFGERVTSAAATFRTLDLKKKECSFIVLNDIHDDVKNFRARIDIANRAPYELVFLNGDIVNDPRTEQQIINHTLKPATELFADKTPFIFIRGNHEVRGAMSRDLKAYVDLPEDRYYFSFQQGPVYFIVLDGGEDKEDSHWAYSGLNDFSGYRDEQTEWLAEEIKKKAFKKAPFRVVLTHIPFYKGTESYASMECEKRWGPLLKKGKIDLHLSGHTHRPKIMDPVKGERNYPIIIGGGKGDNDFTVIRLDVTTKTLTATLIGHDGEIIGTRQIK